jgi:hypothetical protein
MNSKKKGERTASKASKRDRSRGEGSHKKLAEAFIADLDRSWQQHGRETLDRVRRERPKVYFRIMTKLTVALHRVLGKLDDLDRQRTREDVLQRLEQSR